jgi:hypothetical protein
MEQPNVEQNFRKGDDAEGPPPPQYAVIPHVIGILFIAHLILLYPYIMRAAPSVVKVLRYVPGPPIVGFLVCVPFVIAYVWLFFNILLSVLVALVMAVESIMKRREGASERIKQ